MSPFIDVVNHFFLKRCNRIYGHATCSLLQKLNMSFTQKNARTKDLRKRIKQAVPEAKETL